MATQEFVTEEFDDTMAHGSYCDSSHVSKVSNSCDESWCHRSSVGIGLSLAESQMGDAQMRKLLNRGMCTIAWWKSVRSP